MTYVNAIQREPILELLSLPEIAGLLTLNDRDSPTPGRRDICHDQERNESIARLALGLVQADERLLATLGLSSSRAVRFLRSGRGNVAILVESLEHAHALSVLIEDVEIVTGLQPGISRARIKIVVPTSDPRFRVRYVACIYAFEFGFAPRPLTFPATPDRTSPAVLEIDFRDAEFLKQLHVACESVAHAIDDFNIDG